MRESQCSATGAGRTTSGKPPDENMTRGTHFWGVSTNQLLRAKIFLDVSFLESTVIRCTYPGEVGRHSLFRNFLMDEAVTLTAEEQQREDEAEEQERELLDQLQQLHTRLLRVRRRAGGRETRHVNTDGTDLADEFGSSGDIDVDCCVSAKCPRFMEEANKLIVCAVRRPVQLTRSRNGDAWTYRPSQSGFKSSVNYIAETNRVQWVAWPGACVDERAAQEVVRKRLETEHGTSPIFVGRDTQALFEGFCMDTLWPNLHGIPTDFNEKLRPALQQQQYDAYAYVTQLYLEKLCEVYEEGDLILVYDYELMLLPAQLRRRFPDVACGFFLHTPFPSSELFQVS
jgi:hypothetical protein